MKKLVNYIVCMLAAVAVAKAQTGTVWVPDNGNGTYTNPVINADYSDPDVIRVDDYFYLVSSSFEHAPALPVLRSKDLVNWTIIGHALPKQIPLEHFATTTHGEGVWAPSIRYHKNEFYIYYPDPDFGIYMVKTKNPAGPWSDPVKVVAGKGLIDPCPLWDDDGNAYLVHAWAGSRAGIKSLLIIRKMNAAGTATLDEGVMVYDGHDKDPTVEGPKLYKRNGYYYIFAPAGGVSTGWQLALRSKNIYGPYERKVVMDQGSSSVNGPHQGAWVNTVSGEDWFLHFQDKAAYGRVVHLQPMKWVNDWPVIGIDKDGDGKGEPVATYRKPVVAKSIPVTVPATSDEFNSNTIGLQWQWQSNPKSTWAFTNPAAGTLRLFSDKLPDSAKNLWDAGNLFLQKIPATACVFTTKLRFTPNGKIENERAGLVVMGGSYAGLQLVFRNGKNFLAYIHCKDAIKGKQETEKILGAYAGGDIYLRATLTKGAQVRFAYSADGQMFTEIPDTFQAEPGRWTGAKAGLFCSRTTQINDSGFADIDWFRVTPVKQ
ncbi:glycoside hydrolase family 43 protein [Sediminibacterium soli]|uniref:glycoside hydrolase family 43 protein n=1 Tax=Sediminibacterium soli TaxID=2698829 RepID=UPI00137AE0F7|nr:glycoside hydrolase 43 family protein [Sediminibacterium soli]NCI47371.1 glycosyl hydrolase 43 family protein [Sediminibacterium soli]